MTGDTNSVYLRPNIQLEPLVDHWYAWAHLIPPATAARNYTERHIKIMDSYINDPEVHADAVKNPRMAGGPFIDYGGKRVDEIRALRDRTRQNRKHLEELSRALEQLNRMLCSEAKGLSLQPLYAKVPPALRGYVELAYDINANAVFRLIEPLLYKSHFYTPDAQSLMLSEITGDDRPFALSTPRLKSPDTLHIELPFDHECVDQLFRMKTVPQPFNKIRDALPPLNGSEALLSTFMTEQPPPPYMSYSGKGIRWRYFGHACILIETQGLAVLVDPVLSYTYESNISRYTYQDLPDRIDYVLITHNHQDHVLFETLLQIRHKIGHIVVPRNGGGGLQDPSLKFLLEKVGFRNVMELGELEILTNQDLQIIGIPFLGEHADLDIRTKLAYLIKTQRHTVMFAADLCNIEPQLYRHISQDIGSIDVLFVGMECDGAPLTWLYGPLLLKAVDRAVDQTRRLSGSNYEQVMNLVNCFKCKEVYVYAMGLEPWLKYFTSIRYTDQSRPITESNRVIDECRQRNLVCERLFGEKEILVTD
jgi:L-ascorbate metabolism protein UlaG (beta-lactamase superfamily)